MPTRNGNLSDHFDKFIETQVKSGRYSNASEVVREGLRLLEQKEREDRARVQSLRETVPKGFKELDRGAGVVFANPDELDAYLYARRATKSKPARP